MIALRGARGVWGSGSSTVCEDGDGDYAAKCEPPTPIAWPWTCRGQTNKWHRFTSNCQRHIARSHRLTAGVVKGNLLVAK